MNKKINIINSMRFTIETANLTDIKDIFELEKQIFEDPWTIIMFEHIFQNNACNLIVAKHNSKIIGFLASTLVIDELQIDNLAVDKNFRNSLVASSLIKYLVKNTKNFNNIFLEVSVKNTNALSLYLKLGFIKSYIRKKYYSNGDNAIVMVCSKNILEGKLK